MLVDIFNRSRWRYHTMKKSDGTKMIRVSLIAVAVLLIIVSAPASAQTVNSQSASSSDQVAPDEGTICVSSRVLYERISIGRGPTKIEVSLGGGACEPPGSGISDLAAKFAARNSMGDYVEADSCPIYRDRIARLWLARKHNPHGRRIAVRAGQFFITDRKDLFELKSANGKKAAAQWIRRTLAAVRPCWNNFRDDHTRYVVDSLYASLRMAAQ